ncbi:MAG: efflux RND transporter permease subunit [Acidobacteriota bacterium]|nr:efflux RND transporter permease subunit [Acidobacteriota bacterium]
MNALIDWFAKNPVAANLLMIFLIVSGLFATASIKQEVFPEFSLDMVSIEVPYLGAAPEEVESAVAVRVEEAIQGLDGIKQITSTSSEGMASVSVELELGADPRKVVDDIKTNVDAITTFPIEAEKPIIRELTTRRQVVDVAVSGATDELTLKRVAERVRDELAALPEITQVEVIGARPYEIAIEVSEVALRRHGLQFDDVAAAVRRSSLDLPGGSVRADGGEILLRTIGQAYRGEEYEDLTLLTGPDGTRLRLADVASVIDGFAETDQSARFDVNPAVVVSVFRTGAQGAIDVAAAVQDYVDNAQASLPEGLELTVWQDQAKMLENRLSLLVSNGLTGFVLVFISLALFLDLRLAFWTSLGIPVSFLGALWLMPLADVSINVMSLFAFILVLGIVVDDAIVVSENIHTHQERHSQGLRGAIEGAREISTPIIFAVLTSIAAFLPMMFVPGPMGKIFLVIPLIVIPCLFFSLVESLAILPSNRSHLSPPKRRGPWQRFQGLFTSGLAWVIQQLYRPALEVAIRWRYLTVSVGSAMLIVTVGMILGGYITFVFFPSIEADFMSASVTLPQGSTAEATSQAVARIEAGAERLRREVLAETGQDMFTHAFAAVGSQPSRGRGPMGSVGEASAANVGEVTIELMPAEERSLTSEALGNRWRELTGLIPEAVEVSFSATIMNPGEDVNVQLVGPDINVLREAAAAIRRRLAEFTGVYEISDSFRDGKREMRLGIQPSAETLGLTLQDLGRQVRQAFYGEEAQRIQRGRDDIRVMVRYPEDERRSLGNLEGMRIRVPGGGEVPFRDVALVESGRGFSSIRRVDRNRAVSVTAAIDSSVTTSGAVTAALQQTILPDVLPAFAGVTYSFEGIQAEQADSVGGLVRGFVVAVLMIFALLAIPLRSYVQPIIIMSAIPFGLVGAIWGHIVMGLDVTLFSMFGLVALTGVVVNDSLVMVDFINRKRAQHTDLQSAVREAGIARFRPILLTSLTTFAGLAPLMANKSFEAAFLVPMAVSLAFGVLFATFITLALVPIAYLILDDFTRAGRRFIGRAAPVTVPSLSET